MEVEEKATKIKRNSEKRKEKSRFAAKCRRNKESEIFANLAKTLPIKESWTHLDKATIMRLGIAYLRIRKLFNEFTFSDESYDNNDDCHDKHTLAALGGIILVLTLEGDIVYVSNNVSVYLGITQIELMGQNVFDITHPCDHKEIKNILSGKHEKRGKFSLFMRMKSTLNSKGRSLNLKSATYKVLHIVGTMMNDSAKLGSNTHFAAIGYPIPHPADIEIPLGSYTFLSKHSLDMKFTYGDERIQNFLGYSLENLLGKSLYEFHHVMDTDNIQNAFKSLFSKGQSETDHYRFLVKGGGYVWVTTQATIIYSERGRKPESVVCVNYIVSERINESEIYSTYQMEGNEETNFSNKPVSSTSKVIVKISTAEKSERPQLSTSKIFAPRTPEMNKGFLTFADDESGGTTLKDEPDDLTHLAPTPGDVCIALDTFTLNSNVVDDFVTPVGGDDLTPLLHQEKKLDFFVPTIDDGSSSCLSPALSKSPGATSLPSVCSLRDDPSCFEDNAVKSFLNIENEDGDDLCSRAPYISMTEGDDLPLLMNVDYWSTSYSNSSVDSSCSTMMECSLSADSSRLLNFPFINNTVDSYQDHGGGVDPNAIVQKNFISNNIGDNESRKRFNDFYSTSTEEQSAKKRKCQESKIDSASQFNSVLKNLLMTGHDANAGYMCINTRKKISPDKSTIFNT